MLSFFSSAGHKVILLVSGLIIIAAIGTTVLRLQEEKTIWPANILIPTLSGEIASIVQTDEVDLRARLIGADDNGLEIHKFTKGEGSAGFTVLPDVHVLAQCPTNERIGTIEAAMGILASRADRFWLYVYSGNEEENRGSGKTGRELFDGQFWLSERELEISPNLAYLNEHTDKLSGEMVYIMTDEPQFFGCLDSDSDGIKDLDEDIDEDGRWDTGETDLFDADTDDDGIIDGTEIALGTDVLNPDSDGDGIQDGTELGYVVCTSTQAALPETKKIKLTASIISDNPTAILSIVPSTGTYAVGDEFTVDFKIDTGGRGVAAVDIYIAYSNNLQLTGSGSTGSDFPVNVLASSKETNPFEFVRLADLMVGNFNGADGQMITATFRAIAGGHATISFDESLSETLALEDSSNILLSVVNGSYTVTTTVGECGDGVVDTGEECDDGTLNGNPNQCNSTCDGTIPSVNLLCAHILDTDLSIFIPDANSDTTTNPLNSDSDGGGASDSTEDPDANGNVDPVNCETDPNDPSDDVIVCGNGIVQTCGPDRLPTGSDGETCDDGNLNGNPNQCNSICTGQTSATCGNGSIESGEECDDGTANSNINPDVCRTDCTNYRCGDSVADAGETCDDGNADNTDTCSDQCQLTSCGDGIVQNPNGGGISEECDSGTANSDTVADACRTNCSNPICGDSVIDTGETCDDGSLNGDPNQCNSTCDGVTASVCGNGDIEAGEECDDGTANSDTAVDACRTSCSNPICGDSVIDTGEICDDGSLNGDPNQCNSTCDGTTVPVCGNGAMETGEECDDGTANSDTVADACRTSCLNPICGDGAIDTGETCDDGASNGNPNQCDSLCSGLTASVCGNSIIEAGETCDDGNLVPDDGCDASCQAEGGAFTISISDPQTTSLTPPAVGAALADISFTAGGGTINIEEFFVALIGKNSVSTSFCDGNTSFDQIGEVATNVQLRNPADGSIATATLDSQSSCPGDPSDVSFAIYRFANIDIDGTETWTLEVDLPDNGWNEHVKNGDTLQAEFCTSSSQTTDTCDFSPIGIPSTTNYNISAINTSTSSRPVIISPADVLTTTTSPDIRRPTLHFVQQAGTVDTTVLLGTQADIPLLTFDVTANGEDLSITELVLEAGTGTLADLQNFSLFADGSSIQIGVSPVSGILTFNLPTLITTVQAVTLQVYADTAPLPTLSGDVFSLRFASDRPYVSATAASDGLPITGIDTDSICADSCNIFMTTAAPQNFLFLPQGNLFITNDPATPVPSRQLLEGEEGEEILRLELTAQYEGIDVTKLAFADTSGLIPSSLDYLDLYLSGETVPFASATAGACTLLTNVFCVDLSLQELVVADGTPFIVSVLPIMKDVAGGATSGEIIQIELLDTESTGVMSANNLFPNNGDNKAVGEIIIGRNDSGPNLPLVGAANDVVFAKFVDIRLSKPPGTSLIDGPDQAIAAFTFDNHANSINDATVNGVIFDIVSNNISFSSDSFELFNSSDPATKVSCTSSGTEGNFSVTCLPITNNTIMAGTSQSFNLEADIANLKINDNVTAYLTIWFRRFTNRSRTSFSVSESHIEWTDADTIFFWVDHTGGMSVGYEID